MALGNIISGVKGSITINTGLIQFGSSSNVTSRVLRWSLSIAREEHDTTAFGISNNMRTFVGGMASFTGRCEGYLDDTESLDVTQLENEDQAAAEFVLTATTGRTYTFNGIITGVDMGIEKGAHSSFSLTFRGSGAITVA